MTVGKPDIPSLPVHCIGEFNFRARQSFGDDDAGVVAGLHDDPAQQILDPHLLVDFDEHLRAAHLPGFPAYDEFIVEREFADS